MRVADLSERCHLEDRALLADAVDRCLSGASDTLDLDCRLRHDGGAYRWHLVQGAVVRAGNDESPLFVGTSVDITERKAREDELRRAKERAEAAIRAKDEILANVSHEIRTPMNSILGYADLLLEDASTPAQIQALEVVKSAGVTLLAIVDDLLDFSKLEFGRVTLESKPWSPRTTLADTLRALAPHARRKGLYLTGTVEPEVPEHVVGDALRVRQILTNLVGNALKFTATGGIDVRIGAAPAPGGDVELRISVADTGIGIPREKQKAIFEAFQQEDVSTARRFGGTGLGLTISTRLAGLMGGGIDVESEVGRGSTFTFRGRFARVVRDDASLGRRAAWVGAESR